MTNQTETKKVLDRPTSIVTDSATEPETSTPHCSTSDRMPRYEEIARLAYSYYEERGYQGGSPEEDWFRAEEQVKKDFKDLQE